SSAWRFVPAPETRTTRRATMRATLRPTTAGRRTPPRAATGPHAGSPWGQRPPRAQWGHMPPFDQRRGKPPVPMPAEPAAQQRAAAALLVALLSLTGVLALGAPQRGVFLVGYALLAGVVAMWLAVTARMRARRGPTPPPPRSAPPTAVPR